MSTLLDRIETRSTNGRTSTDSATPAERLRTTMAACRLQFTWFGTTEDADRGTEGPGCRAFRRRGPVPVRRQEAAGYQAQRVPGRHSDQDQDHRLLARPDAAVP